VRSGVLTSVHAFASDPARGVFVLALLAVVVGGALALYAWRNRALAPASAYTLTSRETFLLANSVLLGVATATILLGTLYPLALDAFGLGKISVGPPYFNSVFVPVMAALATLLGLGQHARWKRDRFTRLCREVGSVSVVAVVCGLAALAMFGAAPRPAAALGVTLAVWIAASSLTGIVQRCRGRGSAWQAWNALPASYRGQMLAHCGFAITLTGVALVSTGSAELHTRIAPGDAVEVAGYSFRFERLAPLTGPNYHGHAAHFSVTKGDRRVAELEAQKRYYKVRKMAMTEAGIDPGLTRDLYVALGEPLGDGAWSVRLSVKPFIRWLWLGALLMAGGGVLALGDRRLRRVVARKLPVGQTALG
jgi:cytochrome c-type biogenesis protein CcmF